MSRTKNYKKQKKYKINKTQKLNGGASASASVSASASASVSASVRESFIGENYMKPTTKIDSLIEIINSFDNNVSIIIGANNGEEHIKNYATTIKPLGSTSIICISYEHKNKEKKKEIVIVNNNSIIFIKCDFNNLELWNHLKTLKKVNEIIVDWGTSYFLNEQLFNLIGEIGDIMKIIFDLLVKKGRFYSEFPIRSWSENRDIGKIFPNIPFVNELVKNRELCELLPDIGDKDAIRKKKEADFIDTYKSLILIHKPDIFTLEFEKSKTVDGKYPLNNQNRNKEFEFFYFEK